MPSPLIHYPNHLVAGCDEVGRGCLAGPVVAAVVVLPPAYDLPQLDDSKRIRPKVREALAAAIQVQALGWALGEASVREIEVHNIVQATYLAMHRALDKLLQGNPAPTLLLVDGNRFLPYPSISHKCCVKGDATFAAIAAASVVAKVYRDALMQQLALHHPGYEWERNVGYPTPAHRQALQQLGRTPLHRKTFLQQLVVPAKA